MEAGQQVALTYLTAQNILVYLDWRALERCKKVCTLWLDIVNTIQKNLHPAEMVCVYKRHKRGRHNVIFYNNRQWQRRPLLAAVFVKNEFSFSSFYCKDLPKQRCEGACRTHPILDYIHWAHCGESLNVIGAEANHLFFMMPNHNPLQFEHSKVALFCLPGVDNAFSHIITVEDERLDQWRNDDKIIHELLSISLNENIKCIMVYFTPGQLSAVQEKYVVKTLTELQKRQPDISYALGGGLVTSAYSGCPHNLKEFGERLKMVVITTSKKHEAEFDAYSCTLTNNDEIEMDVKSNLLKMSNRIPRRKFSLALKFSCFERKHSNTLEIRTFKDYFPTTPLLGCDAMGEIGLEHLPSAECEPPTKQLKLDKIKRYFENALLSFSTIFIYFTWGELLES